MVGKAEEGRRSEYRRGSLAQEGVSTLWTEMGIDGGAVGSAWEMEITARRAANLEALTSAPCSMRSFTTRSFPPEEAAWSGSTPSRTELMGWPCARAYCTSPMFPLAAAECRPRCGTAWVESAECNGKERGTHSRWLH